MTRPRSPAVASDASFSRPPLGPAGPRARWLSPVLVTTMLVTTMLAAPGGCAPAPTARQPATGTDAPASSAPASSAPASSAPASSASASDPAAVRSAATGTGDTLPTELAVYLRLLEPNGGSAVELVAFRAAHPGWPNLAVLGRRLDQALAMETDPAVLRRLCPQAPLLSAAVLSRCTDPSLAPAARRAWVGGIDTPNAESAFLLIWRGVLTTSDQLDRFARQMTAGNLDAASRTIGLLPDPDRDQARVEVALRRGDPDAGAQAAALLPEQAVDPALVLDLARWLRKAGRLDEAVALWRGRGADAEAAAAPALRAANWSERDALARALLDAHRDGEALAVAADPDMLQPAQRSDSDFLAGWIALRRLHDPARAQRLFESLTREQSVITRTRGLYWSGRARAAQGDAEGAAAWFSQAAAFPTAFYGQLSIARLDPANPQTLLEPDLNKALLRPGMAALTPVRWTGAAAVRLAGTELARAAELLVAWNDPRHARAFLLALDAGLGTDPEHAMAASLADRLGLPDVAVAIARSAGRHGLVLATSGWPRPFAPPADGPVPPALVLAVMRQESSFDPRIVSPAGANGLMQITAGSAQDIARGLGRPELADRAGLFDPATNMMLGSAFLGTLLTRFNAIEPYALAGYNAGPHRVDRWLAQNGDPAHAPMPAGGAGDDSQSLLLDWIETIPFNETRNYVQRVMESQAIYAEPPP